MTVLVVIPLYGLAGARCLDGYDWHQHYAYISFQTMARMVELWLYQRLGGVGMGFALLLFKSAVGAAGGIDFYTDITFLAISYLCGGPAKVWDVPLWMVAGGLFIVGVLILQLLVPLCAAMLFPKYRVLLLFRLNNFDVLADYYNPKDNATDMEQALLKRAPTEPPESESEAERTPTSGSGFQKLKAVVALVLCIVRWIFEDSPQMYLQFRFKNTLPKEDLIWTSLIVAAICSSLGLAASLYDWWEFRKESIEEEEDEHETVHSKTFWIALGLTFLTAVVVVLAFFWVAKPGFQEPPPAPMVRESSCNAGTFSVKDSTECRPCDPGTYAIGQGATECKQCGLGKYAPRQGAVECKVCGVGKYANATGAKTCAVCDRGHYASETGHSSCRQCLEGFYMPSKGAASCKRCPAGSVADTTGASSCKRSKASTSAAPIPDLSGLPLARPPR